MGFRYLTAGEITIAQSMFGNTIDYAQVKIYNEKWISLQPSDRIMAPDGNIYFAPTDLRYMSDFSLGSRDARGLFIHEMTHVWQESHYGSAQDFQQFSLSQRSYDYNSIFSGQVTFDKLQIEAQAQFMQDLYRLRDGAVLDNRPPLAAYEAALPEDYLTSTYTTIIIYNNQHYNFLRPQLDTNSYLNPAISDISSKFGAGEQASCPLVLDLDGDGIELTQLNQPGSVYWDGDVDGFREASGWVMPDDGLLVRDVNGNGKIDNNSELFGNTATYANGFLNLAALDSSKNGKLDPARTY